MSPGERLLSFNFFLSMELDYDVRFNGLLLSGASSDSISWRALYKLDSSLSERACDSRLSSFPSSIYALGFFIRVKIDSNREERSPSASNSVFPFFIVRL